MLKIAIRELVLDATMAYALPSISTVETVNGELILILSPWVVIDFTIGSVGFVISMDCHSTSGSLLQYAVFYLNCLEFNSRKQHICIITFTSS